MMRFKLFLLIGCLSIMHSAFGQDAVLLPDFPGQATQQLKHALRPTQAMRMHFLQFHMQHLPPALPPDFFETTMTPACHKLEDFFPIKAKPSHSAAAQIAPKSSQNVHMAWAAQFGSGMAPSQNWVSDIAVDANGDVYVTGSSVHPETDRDMYTAKYSAAGALLWEARYHDPLRNYDEAHFVAIDKAGYVYVGGLSDEPYTTEVTNVVVLIKYDTNGAQQWVTTFAGEDGGVVDYLDGMALDSRGNICLTGTFRKDGSTSEFIVLKFNPQGEKLWHRRYAEPKNINFPDALAVDAQDNIIVAGRSAIEGGGDELAVVKYDSVGNLLWIARSAENFDRWGWITTMATDPAGNVFVAGRGEPRWGGYYDFYISKFTADGRQDWIQSYDGPGESRDEAHDVVVDKDGNVFVTGESQAGNDENDDFATLKYDNQGNLLWEARYDGPVENSLDRPWKLTLTGDGGVCVTGYSTDLNGTWLYISDMTTVAYDANGNEKWVQRYNGEVTLSDAGHALAADNDGNIFVTGFSDGDFLTIKYDTSGNAKWEQRYHTDGLSDDVPIDMAYDLAGNVIVLASSAHKISGIDLLLLKYDPSGNLRWQWRYDSGDNANEQPVGLGVDAHGDIYTVATSTRFGERQIALAKVSAAGKLLWEEKVASPDGVEKAARWLTIDMSGNVYVTGSSTTSLDPQGFLLGKYFPDGQQAWSTLYRSPDNYYESLGKIEIAPNGDIYLFGSSQSQYPNISILMVKFSGNGELLRIDRFDDQNYSDMYPTTLSMDHSQNIYLLGYIRPEEGFGAISVLSKHSHDGVQQWLAEIPASEGSYLVGRILQIDNSGNPIFLAQDNRRHRMDVIKLNSNGEILWRWGYAPQNILWITPRELTIDGLGNIYMLFSQRQSGPERSGYVAIKLTREGEEAWRLNYVSPGNQPDDPKKLVVDGWGNVFMTGEKRGFTGNSKIHTVKYVQDELANVPKTTDVTENYPNPFKAGTNIRYTLEKTAPVKLVIYNSMGQQVETLVDAVQAPGVYVYNWAPKSQATGVYFYRWQAGGVKEVKKLLLVK
ncbi:MAG: SBBP repeat-containing protein [Deferribacteres bacterium]|nr:SBBP repeat-containing protein [candidate division KSB1 bacterium]MCB9511641.1 SBBP repeat-containing protein [Deferribacteres bacterium]